MKDESFTMKYSLISYIRDFLANVNIFTHTVFSLHYHKNFLP